MFLRNKGGKEVVRELRRRTFEVVGDGDKDLIIFDTPRDMRGTAVLTHANPTGSDKQWVFLPATKRVKRISSSNKSGPFVGSEFAFEDLARNEVEKFSYRYLQDEVVDSADCYVIEQTPTYEDSGYTHQIQWMDKEMYQPRKIEYYDRKGELLKTLFFSDYNQYLDRYWRPAVMRMENHQTGKETELQWNNYQFGLNLSEADFKQSALESLD